MITVCARLTAKPDRAGDLAAIFQQLLPPTLLEAGCLRYEVYQAQDQPALFMTFEQWRDQAAVDAHMASPHVQRAFAAAADVLGAAPEIRGYGRIG